VLVARGVCPGQVCARAAGRRHYNAVRRERAEARRHEVIKLYLQLGGRRGCQAEMARRLGVSQTTISRDMAILWEEASQIDRCPFCGSDITEFLTAFGPPPVGGQE